MDTRESRRGSNPDASGPNDEAEQVVRHTRSLFGAARPFIRREPPPIEEWDRLVAQAIVDEFRGKDGD